MNGTTTQQPTAKPVLPDGISKIALSFSGGGFRAAGFTLGCAGYLQEVSYKGNPLLEKVKFISSASGGSITNLALSAGLRRGDSFHTIHQHLLKQMEGVTLLDSVFEVLADDRAWKDRPEKSRNLINAFALVYDRDFFNFATFDALSSKADTASFVIGQTCVNATEFDNGLNFRWDNSGGLVGNKYLNFKNGKIGAAPIRLGDILASSSCFPGGFEPIMFPQDFATKAINAETLGKAIRELDNYSEEETKQSKAETLSSFGLMDGGIDDNQGIYAFLLADARANGNFDLYFPCDVSSNYLNNPFDYPKPVSGEGLDRTGTAFIKARKKSVMLFFVISIMVFLASVAGAIWWADARQVSLAIGGAALACILLPLTGFWLFSRWIRGLFNTLFPPSGKEGSWGLIFNQYRAKLLGLPLTRLITMALARGSSVLLLADTVYLKRIRQLSYSLLYSNKANDEYRRLVHANNEHPAEIETGSMWNDHIAPVTVYKLATRNDRKLNSDINATALKNVRVSATDQRLVSQVLYPVPAAIRAHADNATAMDTTLWFDKNQQLNGSLKSLVIAGHAAMCFTLIQVAYRFDSPDAEWSNLREELISHWDLFAKDPEWLWKKLG